MDNEKKHSGIFYGWWVVFACALIALMSSSGRFSFTMFFPVLLEDLGWTRAELGFGLTLHMWIYALSAAAVGVIVDKQGPKLIMTVGGVLILLGLILTSRMSTPWQFYVCYGVILPVGVAATLNVANLSTARKWFVKRAGLAVAISISGASLGLAAMAVIAPGLIHTFGWRSSWFYLGIILGIIIVLLALIVVRKDPESMGLFPDGSSEPPQPTQVDTVTGEEVTWTLGEAVKTRSFWFMLFAMAVSGIPIMGITGHIAAWGFDIAKAVGIPEQGAEKWIQASVFLMCIFTVVGSLIGGPLSDKIGRKAVIIGGCIIGFFAMIYGIFVQGMVGLVIFGLITGIFGGAILPLWAAYIGDIFGMTALATLYGFAMLVAGIVGATGPVLFGWIFDRFGSYSGAYVLSAVSLLIALIFVQLTRKELK